MSGGKMRLGLASLCRLDYSNLIYTATSLCTSTSIQSAFPPSFTRLFASPPAFVHPRPVSSVLRLGLRLFPAPAASPTLPWAMEDEDKFLLFHCPPAPRFAFEPNDVDFGPRIYTYASLGGTSATSAGKLESAIWTHDPAAQALTPTWVNMDKTLPAFTTRVF
ncbi:hypothetical protein DFH09DRAFT_1328225 [Mycena vulgaris]|nr:hypothetical protein DFH09DRAFT_1328225 [Mycena vulgaris]